MQRKLKILRNWNIPSEVRGINDLNHLEVGLFAEEYVVELVLDDPVVGRPQIGHVFEASFDGWDEGGFHAFRNVQFELFGKEIFETIFKLHIEPHKCIPGERNKMKSNKICFFVQQLGKKYLLWSFEVNCYVFASFSFVDTNGAKTLGLFKTTNHVFLIFIQNSKVIH